MTRKVKCLILDILALYGCRSPTSAKSKEITIYKYIDEQYRIHISSVQYKKYLTMLIRDYENGYREAGSDLRTFMVCRGNIVIESGKDVHLEDLRKLIPNANKIHSEEYQGLLSIIERRFIGCECDKLVICLDDVLSYSDLFNTLRKHLRDLDQCSIGLTQRVGRDAEVYCFEKTLN